MASQVMGTGARLVSYAGERFLPRQTAASSFPPILDDIDCISVEGLLTRYFNGGRDVTCSGSTEPRTSPLITANWFYLDKLAGNTRYIHVLHKGNSFECIVLK